MKKFEEYIAGLPERNDWADPVRDAFEAGWAAREFEGMGPSVNEKERRMKKDLKMAINIVVGLEPVSAADIAAAMRAQADALDGGAKQTGEAKPPKEKKPAKKAKDEDDGEDNDDSDSGIDEDDSDGDDTDSGDADESADGDGEQEESEEEAQEDQAEESPEKGPSKGVVIEALKALAAKKKKSFAVSVMKKTTGKDSVHDVKPALYGKLLKALKANLK